MEETKTITLNELTYRNKIATALVTGVGTGFIVLGLSEFLTENKANQKPERIWGAVAAGALIIGMAALIRWTDARHED
jgi:lipopolysaccharide export LptBFGC system permease protein LptF